MTTSQSIFLLVLASASVTVSSAFVVSSLQQKLTPVSSAHAAARATRLYNSPGEQEQQDIAAKDEKEVVYFNILTQDGPSEEQQQQPQDLMEAVVRANAAVAAANAIAPINGWVPKEDYTLWGLPGAVAPTGYFDPLGFAQRGTPLNDCKRFREAEVQHGRVAMLAVVGYLASEAIPNGGPFGITGPANDALQQIPAPAFWIMTAAIAAAELYRAQKGWVEPKFRIGSNTLWTLRDNYYPGDLGFDPLGLKPTENFAFQRMQTKELSNGRLAMLGWAGMCAQELVNHRTIAETWDFYQSYYNF
eukprot:CAMPEP_0198154826 /NCGR_PEP_ID=MMETSP1443-20131203/68810_1 /TAXON_ID=186043 /ORGANISM="Entomoneis sp., Strain CCMP2396" /LENGTH=302 /DNA_ID=CAMNT_0043821541 /DNA_START=159 /DNA_END=1067 /DNA_ORIENTATION=-